MPRRLRHSRTREPRRPRGSARARSAAAALAAAVWAGACYGAGESPAGEDTPIPGFDLSRLDEKGLYGPPGGERALDYEFCIPRGDRFRAEVAAADLGARFHAESPGRIGCAADQVLVLGNTHQPGFRAILSRLAALPYVARIVPAWFE